MRAPIEKHRIVDHRYAFPNEVEQLSPKTKLLQNIKEKVPINSVIGLGDIQFEHHTRFTTFIHRMNDLMGGDGRINNLAIKDKPLLSRDNQGVQKGFKPIN